MACEQYAQQLETLKTQRAQQIEILDMGYIKGPGLDYAQARLEEIEADIAATQKKLDECRANAAAPSRPFVAEVKDISCSESQELTKDEPYLLITSIDMAARLSAGPVSTPQPQAHCFQVGPWTQVARSGTHSASSLPAGRRPAFWDLNSRSRIIAHPHDVIFLASVVEHDGSSAEAIRSAVQTAMSTSVIANGARNYATLVSTLASDMAAAIDSSRLAGVGPSNPNLDDRVGDVQPLNLSPEDLDTVNGQGRLEKPVSFVRKNNSGKITDRYDVTFVFTT